MSKELTRDSWLFVLRGILAIGLGILTFVYPGPTLAALIVVFAVYAIFNGIFAITAGVTVRGGPSWWLVVGGVAGIAIGVFTFFQPSATALALVIAVGIWAIVTGTAELVAAVTLGNIVAPRWLIGLSGVVALAFGVLLIMFPGDGILSVLWLVGYYAIFAGVMNLAIGFGLRDTGDTLSSFEATSKPANS
jgi:uncharacterized membrane protein HdeD (DUF308 family)